MAREFEVLKIDELVRPSDRGGIEKYYRHTIRTRGGTVLTMDIGEGDMAKDKVSAALVKRATEFDAIKAL